MALRIPPKHDSQIDLFVPAFVDIASRDGVDMMEFPFFSLSKKKRYEPISYQNENRGIKVLVTGARPYGIATIWDKDILIWCISQIREAMDRGEKPKRVIYFHPYQLLKFIRRAPTKLGYERLENAIIRLKNTNINTSIRTDEKTSKIGFSWIDNYATARENTSGEAAGRWMIILNEWIYQAAIDNALVLTLDDDYFLLTGGRERRLYLLARKHGGYQGDGFTMSLKVLYEKSGAEESYKYWARAIRKIVEADSLPGYHLEIWRKKETSEEFINFKRRSQLGFDHPAYEMDIPRPLKKRISGL